MEEGEEVLGFGDCQCGLLSESPLVINGDAAELDCLLVGDGCGAHFDVGRFLAEVAACVDVVDEFCFVRCIMDAQRDGPGDLFLDSIL